MTYLRTGVWFGPAAKATFLFSPCMGFFSCHGNCLLSQCWWVCRLANVIQWLFNEVQVLLEVKC